MGESAAATSDLSRVRILPLGDSITAGSEGHASYRRALWHRLQEQGYPTDFVGSLSGVFNGTPPDNDFDLDHEGHSGWRADEVAREVAAWTEKSRPEVVLLQIGTNDVAQYRSPASIIDNTGRIIDEIRRLEPSITILLATILPTANGGQFDSIPSVNALIPDLVRSRHAEAAPVLMADIGRGFDPGIHTYDRVHPNDQGEDLVAANWYSVLAPVLDALPPRAVFTVAGDPASVGESVVFDASASFAAGVGRSIQRFYWVIGDEGWEATETVSHVFDTPGLHSVRLTVTDDLGRTGTHVRTVSILGPISARPTSWGRIKLRHRS